MSYHFDPVIFHFKPLKSKINSLFFSIDKTTDNFNSTSLIYTMTAIWDVYFKQFVGLLDCTIYCYQSYDLLNIVCYFVYIVYQCRPWICHESYNFKVALTKLNDSTIKIRLFLNIFKTLFI